MKRVGAIGAVALAVTGCFPDYSYSDHEQIEPDTERVYAADESFEVTVQGLTATLSFEKAFDMDGHEVTVGRYRAWVDAGSPLPCDDGAESCSLDPGGPYAEKMVWQPVWTEIAQDEHYSIGEPPNDCPRGDGGDTIGMTESNYEIGDDDLPMTCVSWVQAVAFCAWEGRRLPTEAEWQYVAAGPEGRRYPWGESVPTCEQATVLGCDFPKPVGSAPLGVSEDGVEDLTGSVFEWVWDAHWDDPPLNDSVSYAGPPLASGDTSLDQEHFRNGGAFFFEPTAPELHNDTPDQFAARAFYGDAGFRCVRTVSKP